MLQLRLRLTIGSSARSCVVPTFSAAPLDRARAGASVTTLRSDFFQTSWTRSTQHFTRGHERNPSVGSFGIFAARRSTNIVPTRAAASGGWLH